MNKLLLCAFLLLATTLNVYASESATSSTTTSTSTSTSTSEELYSIEGVVKLPPGAKSRPSSLRLLLNGGQHIGMVRADGSFIMQGIPAGTYVLEVTSVEFIFLPIRIDVSAREKGRIRASPAHRRTEKLSYPLSLRPDAQPQYFMHREPYSVMTMFRNNPMLIMMAFTLVIVLVFPKMLNSMDPAEMEEMRKMQSKMSISNILKGQIPDGSAPPANARQQRRLAAREAAREE